MNNKAQKSTVLSALKVAIVHEWFVNYAGSERVVEQLLDIFPQAQLFSLVDFLKEDQRFYLKGKVPKISFIQKLPFAKKSFRNYFPLFPIAVESHDLRGFDLIISSSHLSAKGVIINQDQLHITYCHSPCRFAWDLYHQYLEESGLNKGLKGMLAQYFLSKLRIWDQISNQRVHHFIANSGYISKRIQHVYHRTSQVIYPPVDTNSFELAVQSGDYYFTASRLVPYKKIDLIVAAFAQMPDKKLIVVGDGPESSKISRFVASNIEFRKEANGQEFKALMLGCKAFVFAAEEDFGITLAEAQSAGKPVIAFAKGGASEIILDGESGILFPLQTAESIKIAVVRYENEGISYSPIQIRERAQKFSIDRFKSEMIGFVEEKWLEFKS